MPQFSTSSQGVLKALCCVLIFPNKTEQQASFLLNEFAELRHSYWCYTPLRKWKENLLCLLFLISHEKRLFLLLFLSIHLCVSVATSQNLSVLGREEFIFNEKTSSKSSAISTKSSLTSVQKCAGTNAILHLGFPARC